MIEELDFFFFWIMGGDFNFVERRKDKQGGLRFRYVRRIAGWSFGIWNWVSEIYGFFGRNVFWFRFQIILVD